MFKVFGKIAGFASPAIVGFFLVLLFGAIWLTIGALFWGWIIMLIVGATGHPDFGYHTAFLWGYLAAFLTGS
jgi:hypothetical protein